MGKLEAGARIGENHLITLSEDFFSVDLRAMSDENEERFHQDIKEMETKYQGCWDAAMMADCCWTLKRDIPSAERSKMSRKRKFMF